MCTAVKQQHTGTSMQTRKLFILDHDGYIQRTLPSVKMTPWHMVQSSTNNGLVGRWQSYIRVPRHLKAKDVRRALHDSLQSKCNCSYDCGCSNMYVRTLMLARRRMQVTLSVFSPY